MTSAAFTVGNHTGIDSKTRRINRQDGYISSIQAFIYLLALGISMSIAHSLTIKIQTVYVSRLSVEVIIVVYMIGASAFMLYLWRSPKAEGHHVRDSKEELNDDKTTEKQSFNQDIKAKIDFQKRIRNVLPVIGIVTFFILGSFLDFFRIFAHSLCLVQFNLCGGFYLASYIWSIIFHIVRFCFMGIEMIFCYVFHNRVVESCAKVRYGLLLIVAASFVVWFDCTMYDSNGVFNSEDMHFDNKSCPYMTDHTNKNSSFTKCVTENTELYISVKFWSPFLYPLNIEFLLLVIEMLMHLFFSAETADKIAKRRAKLEGNDDTQGDAPPGKETETKSKEDAQQYEPPGATAHVLNIDAQSDQDGKVTVVAEVHTGSSGDQSEAKSMFSSNRSDPQNDMDKVNNTVENDDTEITIIGDGERSEESTRSTTNNDSSQTLQLNTSIQTPGDYLLRRIPRTSEKVENKDTSRFLRWCSWCLCCKKFRYYRLAEEVDKRPNANSMENYLMRTLNAVKIKRDHIPRNGPAIFSGSLVLNIVLVMFGVLTFQTNKHCTWLLCYVITKIIYWIPTIAICLMGFKATRNFESKMSKFNSFSGLEMMVVVSSFGFCMYACFTIAGLINIIFGSESTKKTEHKEFPPGLPWALLFDNILNLIQYFIQTNFLAHAGNVMPPIRDSDALESNIKSLENMESSDTFASRIQEITGFSTTLKSLDNANDAIRSRRLFQNALMYNIMCNFVLWIIDSFIEMKNPYLEPVQEYYYEKDTWHFISHMTMPLSLFFRFNSAILFAKIYLEK